LPAKTKKTAAKAAAKGSSKKPSMAAPLKGRLNLITCVLQRGKANDVAKAAMQAGAKGATVVYGRGMGVGELMGALGFAIVPQKEVIQIVTTADSTRKLFDVVVEAAELNKAGMGIAYIIPIHEAAGLFQ
jgi:nitrogen regulatory protein P-II 1